MKRITEFTIVERRQYGEKYFAWTLRSPEKLQPIRAGQFVEVEVRDCADVMLRRPISIQDFDLQADTITLLVQIVGKGTRKLATLNEGDSVNIIYPLGNGFAVCGNNPLLVGGGAGIAPLLGLAKAYRAKGVTPTILLGGRTESLIPARDLFNGLGTIGFATEDGSLGEKGLVTQHSLFNPQAIKQSDNPIFYDHISTCGPTPMMKAVAKIAHERSIPCEVSLENMMACGVGACLCCVTDTDEGHKCVCKDGPVFNSEKILSFKS